MTPFVLGSEAWVPSKSDSRKISLKFISRKFQAMEILDCEIDFLQPWKPQSSQTCTLCLCWLTLASKILPKINFSESEAIIHGPPVCQIKSPISVVKWLKWFHYIAKDGTRTSGHPAGIQSSWHFLHESNKSTNMEVVAIGAAVGFESQNQSFTQSSAPNRWRFMPAKHTDNATYLRDGLQLKCIGCMGSREFQTLCFPSWTDGMSQEQP